MLGHELIVPRTNKKAHKVAVLLVEGFLLYYSALVRKLLDIRIFIRISRAMMHKRRIERANYVLDDGEVWEDPPFYFDEIVWPSYLEANAGIFEQGDVENGKALVPTHDDAADGGPVQYLAVVEAESSTKQEVASHACNVILSCLMPKNN